MIFKKVINIMLITSMVLPQTVFGIEPAEEPHIAPEILTTKNSDEPFNINPDASANRISKNFVEEYIIADEDSTSIFLNGTTTISELGATTATSTFVWGPLELSDADESVSYVDGEFRIDTKTFLEDYLPGTFSPFPLGLYETTVNVSDGDVETGDDTGTILMEVNTKPDIETDGTVNSMVEFEIFEGDDFTSTSTASDPDGHEVSFIEALLGDDAQHFEFDFETGVVTSLIDFDYEFPVDLNGDNIYEIKVRAKDEFKRKRTQVIKVEVLDVDNDPTISVEGTSTDIDENATSTTLFALTATDPQNDDVEFELNTSKHDSQFFELTSPTSTTPTSTGITEFGISVTFLESPDFETPLDKDEDNVYELAVNAKDPEGNYRMIELEVTVNPVNDNSPSFTNNEGAELVEVTMLDDIKRVLPLEAVDADLPAETLTFSVDASSTDATLFKINFVHQRLAFKDLPDPGIYNVTVVVSDGENTDFQDIIVNVLDSTVNYAPEITTFGGSASSTLEVEEGFLGLIENIDAFDLNGDVKLWSIDASSTDADFFKIVSNNGKLKNLAPFDYENPEDENADNIYEITVIVSDEPSKEEDAATSSVDLFIEVTDIQEAPEFSTTTGSVYEETHLYEGILSIEITDPQGDLDSASYSTSSPDSEFFSVYFESYEGEGEPDSIDVSISSPIVFDYENPLDENGDNIYEIPFSSVDTEGNEATATVTIEVMHINEYSPVLTYADGSATSTIDHPEGETDVDTITADDEDAIDEIMWGLATSSPDFDLFSIGSTTGELTFNSAPDFDTPLDANGNNVYEVEVIVSDTGEPTCDSFAKFVGYEFSEGAEEEDPYVGAEEDFCLDFYNYYYYHYSEGGPGYFIGEDEIDFEEFLSVTSPESTIYLYINVTDVVVATSTRLGGGGSSGRITYACRDEDALNYEERGVMDSDLCEYPEGYVPPADDEDEEEASTETTGSTGGPSDSTGTSGGGGDSFSQVAGAILAGADLPTSTATTVEEILEILNDPEATTTVTQSAFIGGAFDLLGDGLTCWWCWLILLAIIYLVYKYFWRGKKREDNLSGLEK